MLTIFRESPLGLPLGDRFASNATPATPAALAAPAAPDQGPRRHWAQQALDTLLEWRDRARERHALAQLDDRMLRDIGVSRADVYCEYRKPFWRP